MPNSTVASGTPSAPMNVFARFIGIITAPKATFQSVVANPKVLGMLILVCVLSAVLLGGFFATETGQNAWLEAATNSPMAGDVSDKQYEAMRRMAGYAGYLAAAQALVGVPLLLLVVAGVLFAVFNAAMGGEASFKQVFAIAVHAWVILTVSQLFTLPLSYWRGTLSSATNIGVLFPMIDDSSFLGHFLGVIDLFWIWTLIVLAMGLAVLYRRKTQPIALSFGVIYLAVAVIIAVVKSS